MDRDSLYEKITKRKASPDHLKPYNGGNGRIDKFLDLVRKGELSRGGEIIDVGGSHGDLLDLALREGLFSGGCVIDISYQSVKTARERGLEAYVVDVDRSGLGVAAESVDCVVALDFIEHIIDPEAFARDCYRVLRPSGYVFINTPNISYWRNVESLVCDGVFPHTSGDQEVYHGGHLGFYNELDIRHIFERAGFKEFEVFADTVFDPSPPIWHNLLKVSGGNEMRVRMLSYPNLLISCRKK